MLLSRAGGVELLLIITGYKTSYDLGTLGLLMKRTISNFDSTLFQTGDFVLDPGVN